MIQKGRKIGVNEPCPCGSGRKYKKCCKDKGIDFSQAPVARKHPILSKYNTADLLKKLAGLSIMPENFGKFYRLENATMAVLENVNSSLEVIPHSAFAQWLGREYSIEPMEDPVVNFVTDLVTYDGGDYLVFPGLTLHGAYNIRNLLFALFRNRRYDLPEEFLRNCDQAIRFLLLLSNTVAKRLGFERYQVPPETEGELYVPDPVSLSELAKSVAFSEDEMNALLAEKRILPTVIGWFALLDQNIHEHPADSDEPPIAIKPLIRINREYILASPTNVCNALESFIWAEARKFAVLAVLKQSLADVLWRNSVVYLQKLGFQPMGVDSSVELGELPSFSEIVFRFDDDKVAYLNLKGLPVAPDWQFSGDSEEALLDSLAKQTQIDPSRILLIDVIFRVGEDSFFPIRKPEIVNRISLTTFEIEILEKSGKTDAIGLWQFAEAMRRRLSNAKIPFYSFMDIFSVFKAHNDSFYLGDDEMSEVMMLDVMGCGSEFVLDAFRKEDAHSVNVHVQGHLAPMLVQRRDQYVPIYHSQFDFGKRIRICIDAYSQPIWVQMAIERNQILDGVVQFSTELLDSLGFWLWKLLPALKPFMDKLPPEPIYLWLALNPVEAFQIPLNFDPMAESFADELEISTEGWKIYMDVPPSILPYIDKPDNEGERILISKLLEGINELFLSQGAPMIPESAIQSIVDEFVPFGKMKRLIMLDTNINQVLTPGHMLPPRYVQSFDVGVILDSIVPALGKKCPPIGPIPDSTAKRNLTKDIVLKVLLPSLNEQLRRYDSTELIKRLIGLNEGLHYEKEKLRLSTPTQIACFVSKEEQTEKLEKKFMKLDPTTIAIRCLLEHLAAEPSTGAEPISTTVIDRLVATMEQIVQWGAIGDELEHGLFESGMSILPSNRVGIDHKPYDAVMKPFRTSKSAETVLSTLESYLEVLPADTSIETSSLDQLASFDRGFVDEFGISFTRICHMMHCLVAVGFSQPVHYAMLSRIELFTRVNETLKETFTQEEFDLIIDYLHLWNRGKVQTVPEGYESWDISPWRFNRRLSLLRKPLIRIDNPLDATNPSYIWGPRHVLISIWTLIEQCRYGRLRVREGGKLNSVISSVSQKLDGVLVADVASLLISKVSFLKTDVWIKPKGELNHSEDIGDVDILAIDTVHKRVYSLECKNIAPSRNAMEMAGEVSKFLHPGSNGRSYIDQHERRHQWLLNNIPLVSTFTGIDLAGYSIRSMFITREDMITPYLKANQLKMPFATKFGIQEKGLRALEEAWDKWEQSRPN